MGVDGRRESTTGKFEHMSFPGGHFFIKDHQKRILEIINQIGNGYPQAWVEKIKNMPN